MAETKGLAAVEILSQDDVIKEFADVNNPIPIQILSQLVGVILNKDDDFAIKKEYREEGPTSGGAMLRNRLIQRYIDQPDNFSLKQLIDVLDHFNTNVKLTDLLCSKCNYVVSREETPVSHHEEEMIKNIKAYLQLMCENVRKVWGKLLNETSLEKCFVEPEIVEEEIGEDGKRRKKPTGKSVTNYKDLFDIDTLGDRIIIDGDPGMGKTTYVNKLTLDWTWNEESEHYSDDTRFLQSKFISVFLIPLRSLNGGRANTFAQAASIQLRNCGSWLNSKYHSSPSECLLILDAFDEYDGSCQEINEIINGSQLPRLKVIITTRPSHLDRLPIKNQWLAITGLTTPEKRESFLIKQGWGKLQERDMIINILSTCGVLWHTPLYLVMLCVLYKLKNVVGFDPRNPNCFHVLVTLFTERIMSRKSKEGTLSKEVAQLKSEERQKLKLHLRKCAFDQFSQSNPWIVEAFATSASTSDSDDLRELSGQFGLLIIREEENLITGESIESVSFVHQLFLEYYAAVEFGTIFNSCTDKKGLVKLIKKNLGLTDSPFSYFLAAECKEYKEILVKGQITYCGVPMIYIKYFPWLPEILISNKAYNRYGQVGEIEKDSKLEFDCSGEKVKSFWDFVYVKKLCSIAKPRSVTIGHAVLGYHDQSLDYILSLVNQLKLRYCNCDDINLDKQYRNLTNFQFSSSLPKWVRGVIVMLKHFPNLQKLSINVNITNESIGLLCDALQNMNHLQELELWGCFDSSQSAQCIIQLANTIRTSSLCLTLKELNLGKNIPDTETESSSDILGAISKCVQLEALYLGGCFTSPQSVQSVIQLANTIETSSVCQTLKILSLRRNILDTETESSIDILMRAISKCVQLEDLNFSDCQIKVQSLDIIKENIQNSPQLKNNLRWLDLVDLRFLPPHTITQEDLDKWKSDIKSIVPRCYVRISPE